VIKHGAVFFDPSHTSTRRSAGGDGGNGHLLRLVHVGGGGGDDNYIPGGPRDGAVNNRDRRRASLGGVRQLRPRGRHRGA